MRKINTFQQDVGYYGTNILNIFWFLYRKYPLTTILSIFILYKVSTLILGI